MILRRRGNKKKLAKKIQAYFPPHKIYIEPFFGAGGMFFNKPKAKYNIVNDLDSDVFNLFQVVMNNKQELEDAFYIMPIHSDLLEYWKENKEEDPIKKALRFLMLSNFTIMGSGSGIRAGASGGTNKNIFIHNIDSVFDRLFEVQFMNKDFRKFLTSISFDNRAGKGETKESFIYCDPPYVGTVDNYSNSFTQQDSIDLFNSLTTTGCPFAMSEFNNPFILDQAERRGLNVITIGERQNLKNRRTEILITNYENRQLNLFNK